MSDVTKPRGLTQAMLVISIVYGAVVGVLFVTDNGSAGTVAAVGGIVVGGLWALTAVLGGRARSGA